MKNEVIDFISRRFPINCYWLDGNCYYFSLILHNRFPNSTIYYDCIDGHFITKIGDEYYDWHGVVFDHTDALVPWDEFEQYDSLLYERIKRDVLY